jgi:hypothetical protein
MTEKGGKFPSPVPDTGQKAGNETPREHFISCHHIDPIRANRKGGKRNKITTSKTPSKPYYTRDEAERKRERNGKGLPSITEYHTNRGRKEGE